MNNDKGFSAKIELDVVDKNGIVKRTIKTVKPNADLFTISGERELYEGYIIEGIDCTEGREAIEFSNKDYLKLGDTMGSIEDELLKRAQIRRTIEVHLQKELQNLDKNIKVLSLFFIDKVENYRLYDRPDSRGIYAKMFEEIYTELIALPKYEPLRKKFPHAVEKVHDGYFSKDGKGKTKTRKAKAQTTTTHITPSCAIRRCSCRSTARCASSSRIRRSKKAGTTRTSSKSAR